MKPFGKLSLNVMGFGLLLAGCGGGDGDSKPVDASTADAQVADASLVDGGTVDGQAVDGSAVDVQTADAANNVTCNPTATPPLTYTRLVVAGTDFGTPGTLATINLTTRVATRNLATVGSDPVLRVFGTCLFVVNRSTDSNIQVLRTSDLALVAQYSTGAGSNPQDIAIISATKAYVARYDVGSVLIVNPLTGAQQGTISLAQFDTDGNPQMGSIVAHNAVSQAYVTLQTLDSNFAPQGVGKIVIIDSTTNTVVDADPVASGVQALPLVKQNPFGLARLDGNKVAVATVGTFSGTTGCFEKRTVFSSGVPLSLTADPCIVTDMALGGTIAGFASNSMGTYFAVAKSFTVGELARIGTTGSTVTPIQSTAGLLIADVVADMSGALWAADRKPTAPGIRAYSASGVEITTAPIDIGKPPTNGGLVLLP